MNKFTRLTTMIVAAFMATSFSACGSDDDDDEGRASTSIGQLGHGSGLRLKSACGWNYTYDSKGRLKSIVGRYDRWDLSYNPNKVLFSYSGEDGGEEVEYSVSYNSEGFVTNISGSSQGEDSEGRYDSSGKISFSYDGNGHLTKMSLTGSESYYDEERRRRDEKWTETHTLTWSKNLLKRVEWTSSTKTNNGEYAKELSIFTLDYEDDKNTYLQYANFFDDLLPESQFEMLSYVGLLGKGPATLPSVINEEYEREDNYDGQVETSSSDHKYYYSYTFNDDGSLNNVYSDRTRYYFTYEQTEQTRATQNVMPTDPAENDDTKPLLRLFRHSPRHRH